MRNSGNTTRLTVGMSLRRSRNSASWSSRPVDTMAAICNRRRSKEAKRNVKFDGTRSILDMERISASPEAGAVSPVPHDIILAIFKTDRPTRQMVERAFRIRDEDALDELIESIDRGEGRYIVLFRGDEPVEIFFCGYSYD